LCNAVIGLSDRKGREHDAYHHRRQLIQDLRISGDLVLVEMAVHSDEGAACQRGDLDIHPG
jgi:hypothetical protein